MPTITRFEEIEARQTARELTKLIYSFTDEGKLSRDFGLKDQIRRASVSIMSNISEGFESQTQAQFIRYLGIAKASAGEVRSQLYVSRDLDYITQEQFAKAFAIAEKPPVKLPALSLISNRILNREKSEKNLQNTKSNLPTFKPSNF